MQIQDGTGTGHAVKVTDQNRMDVSSRIGSRVYYASRIHGDSYCWTAVSADVAAGVGGIHLTNNSTSHSLFIEKIYVWADVVNQFKIWSPATYTAQNGTAIVGLNLNRASANAADATCTANETSNTFVPAQTLVTVRNTRYVRGNGDDLVDIPAASQGQWIEFGGALILGYHNAIAVELVADTAAFEATIIGYFHD